MSTRGSSGRLGREATREGDGDEVAAARCDRQWRGQRRSTTQTSGNWVREKKIEEERRRGGWGQRRWPVAVLPVMVVGREGQRVEVVSGRNRDAGWKVETIGDREGSAREK